MTKRITAGSLICAKRNIGGLGIVLRRVKDINLYAEFDLSEAFLKLYDKNHPQYIFKASGTVHDRFINYTLQLDTIDSIDTTIIERKPEVEDAALTAFWSHNRAYSVIGSSKNQRALKPKVDFCLIHWTRPPSDYGDTPSSWYIRNGPVWMITTSIKNK